MATILLLNMGGPSTLDEVRPFLRNLFSDPMILDLPGGAVLRPFLARLIPAVRTPQGAARLRLDRRRVAVAAAPRCAPGRGAAERARRAADTTGVPVEVVMRYTPPRAAEVLARLAARGETRALALPLYPQECRATTGSSLAELELAAAAPRAGDLQIAGDPLLAPRPGLPRGAGRAGPGRPRRRCPQAADAHAVLLFSAHGVPEALPRARRSRTWAR